MTHPRLGTGALKKTKEEWAMGINVSMRHGGSQKRRTKIT